MAIFALDIAWWLTGKMLSTTWSLGRWGYGCFATRSAPAPPKPASAEDMQRLEAQIRTLTAEVLAMRHEHVAVPPSAPSTAEPEDATATPLPEPVPNLAAPGDVECAHQQQ